MNHLFAKEIMDTVLDAVEKIWEFDVPPEFDGTYPIDTFEHVVDYGRAEVKRYLQEVSSSVIALVEGNEQWHKNNGREGTLVNPEIKYLPLNFKFSIMHFGLY